MFATNSNTVLCGSVHSFGVHGQPQGSLISEFIATFRAAQCHKSGQHNFTNGAALSLAWHLASTGVLASYAGISPCHYGYEEGYHFRPNFRSKSAESASLWAYVHFEKNLH